MIYYSQHLCSEWLYSVLITSSWKIHHFLKWKPFVNRYVRLLSILMPLYVRDVWEKKKGMETVVYPYWEPAGKILTTELRSIRGIYPSTPHSHHYFPLYDCLVTVLQWSLKLQLVEFVFHAYFKDVVPYASWFSILHLFWSFTFKTLFCCTFKSSEVAKRYFQFVLLCCFSSSFTYPSVLLSVAIHIVVFSVTSSGGGQLKGLLKGYFQKGRGDRKQLSILLFSDLWMIEAWSQGHMAKLAVGWCLKLAAFLASTAGIKTLCKTLIQ